MCVFSSPKVPSVPPPPPPPPEPAQSVDPSMQEARDKQKKQARLMKGHASTLLTGGQGDLSSATTQGKTLLGQ